MEEKSVSRREFLKLAGMAGAVVGLAGGLGAGLAACGSQTTTTTTAASGATTTAASGVTTTAASGVTTTAASAVTTTVASSGAAVEMKAIHFLPGTTVKSKLFKQYVDGVNKAANGALKITVLGGPEVVGQQEMAAAVKNGMVQMALIPGGYIETFFKEATLLTYSTVSWEDEVKSGVHEMLDKMYNEKANMKLVGRINGTNEPVFLLHVNRKAKTPQELAGLTIGASGPYQTPMIHALKMEVKSVPLSEAYTALERKLVDGWLAPASGILPVSAQEQLKYGIDHSYFTDSLVVVANLDFFKSMPADLQALVTDTLAQMSVEIGRLDIEDEMNARKAFAAAGVEYYKFSDADAKFYLDTIFAAQWAAAEKDMPETAPAIRKLISLQS